MNYHHSFNDLDNHHRKCISNDIKQHAVKDYAFTKNSLLEGAELYKIAKNNIVNWMKQMSQSNSEIDPPCLIPVLFLGWIVMILE